MNLKILIYCFVFIIFDLYCFESVTRATPTTKCQAVIAGLTTVSASSNFYVSKSGNDRNNGTSLSPFLTIQKAADIVNPGDTVTVRDGVYSNTIPNYDSELAVLIINRSGTSASWITFKSENQGGAVLDGLNFATQHGIMMNASYVRIEGFEIKNILFWAVSAWPGSSNTIFKNNYIHDIGNVCSANTNGFSAFNIMGNSNVVIESNKIKNIGRLSPDEGCTSAGTNYKFQDHGIYITGCSNITMRFNIFIDCDNGWAIHLFSVANTPSSNISILNNTFYTRIQRSPGQIVLATPITNIVIANNLFIMSADADLIGFSASYNGAIYVNSDYSTVVKGGTIRNNMMYRGNGSIIACYVSYIGIATTGNIVNTNPLVVDLANYDFRLQPASPAINAGVDLGFTTDHLGNKNKGLPDIGAFGSAIPNSSPRNNRNSKNH